MRQEQSANKNSQGFALLMSIILISMFAAFMFTTLNEKKVFNRMTNINSFRDREVGSVINELKTLLGVEELCVQNLRTVMQVAPPGQNRYLPLPNIGNFRIYHTSLNTRFNDVIFNGRGVPEATIRQNVINYNIFYEYSPNTDQYNCRSNTAGFEVWRINPNTGNHEPYISRGTSVPGKQLGVRFIGPSVSSIVDLVSNNNMELDIFLFFNIDKNSFNETSGPFGKINRTNSKFIKFKINFKVDNDPLTGNEYISGCVWDHKNNPPQNLDITGIDRVDFQRIDPNCMGVADGL